MDISFEQLTQLVASPTESLNVEMKTWIDPSTPEGKAKVIKALVALRNRNGGVLLIGFDNKTGLPDPCTIADPKSTFHPDIVQGLIGKHAQKAFEVSVHFVDRDSNTHPVIVVPSGIVTPVAIKSAVIDGHGKEILKTGEVPFRTLSSNNTVSSAAVRPADWDELVEICFDNREADVARFIRRHLGGLSGSDLADILQDRFLDRPRPTMLNYGEIAKEFADKYWEKYSKRMPTGEENIGTFEVSAIVEPQLAHQATTEDLLNKILISNPNIRSWPIWLDTRNFVEKDHRYKMTDGGYEASFREETFWDHIELYRIEPEGRFYACKLLIDDANAKARKVKQGISLEPTMAFVETVEAIAVCIAFSRTLQADLASSNIHFYFRWRGLANRRLSGWTGTLQRINSFSIDDSISSSITVPVDTAVSGIVPYAMMATQDLYAAFQGFSFPGQSAENAVKRLLARDF